ncbi:hypothetical protein B0H17DRAFT_1063682, partial [Mycena rosella]
MIHRRSCCTPEQLHKCAMCRNPIHTPLTPNRRQSVLTEKHPRDFFERLNPFYHNCTCGLHNFRCARVETQESAAKRLLMDLRSNSMQ